MKQAEKDKLLQACIAGTISVEDRRRLELEAMEDDFLFDALEGVQQVSTENMSRVQARLYNKVKKKKRRILWMPAVAACLLLISAVFLWQNFGDLESTDLAENIETSQSTPVDKQEDVAIQQDETNTTNVPAAAPKAAVRKKEKKNVTPSTTPPIVAEEISVEEEMDDLSTIGDLNTEYSLERNAKEIANTADEAEPAPPPAVANYEADIESVAEEYAIEPREENKAEKDDAAGAFAQSSRVKKSSMSGKSEKRKSTDMATFSIKGVVLDELSEPIIGANVIQKKTGMGTFTNINGAFDIELTDKSIPLEINYIGYETLELALSSEDYYTINLKEANSELSEIIVTSNTQEATPDMGWNEFNKYIRQNIEMGQDEEANSVSMVKLHFTVGKNRMPNNYKIIKETEDGLGQQIIDLIKKAGEWSPGEVTYEIEF